MNQQAQQSVQQIGDIANQIAKVAVIVLAMYGLRELAKRMAKGLGWQ